MCIYCATVCMYVCIISQGEYSVLNCKVTYIYLYLYNSKTDIRYYFQNTLNKYP